MSSYQYAQEFGQTLNEQGYVPARIRRRMAVGVDLGTINDSTSITIMESIEEPIEEIGADLIQKLSRPRYQIRGLKRLPLGLTYPQIVTQVGRALMQDEVRGATLVLDRTGCGVPTYDLFVAAGFDPIGITITSSIEEGKLDHDGHNYHVGKLALVSRLQTELQVGNLKMPRDLPETKVFLDELRNFAVTISDAGYASFNASKGHDDTVISAALALWILAPRSGGDVTCQRLEL